MKTKASLFVAITVSAISLHPSFLRAQGALTPPGPPAPTMKSLDQIEPRTPISSAPFIISTPGSYYLTTNLNAASGDGITISNNNVTVDLNGFALTGNSSGYGINVANAQTNVTVRNGSMSGWQFGVSVQSANPRNVVLECLTVSSCANYGIFSSGPVAVLNCLCVSNGFDGINVSGGGQITDCDASDNGNNGIHSFNGVVRNCRVVNNGFYGIYVAPGRVSGCWVQNNVRSGIIVDAPGSEVIGNTCIGNNTSASTLDAGIYVNDNHNRIEDNHVSASGYAGISVAGVYSGNILVKNSVSGNGANNYLTPGNQVVGPLITTYGTITNSNPWANFSY